MPPEHLLFIGCVYLYSHPTKKSSPSNLLFSILYALYKPGDFPRPFLCALCTIAQRAMNIYLNMRGYYALRLAAFAAPASLSFAVTARLRKEQCPLHLPPCHYWNLCRTLFAQIPWLRSLLPCFICHRQRKSAKPQAA